MLQFDRSVISNKNAAWIDTVNTGSDYYTDLKIAYSQSFDQSNGTIDITTVDSAPNAYRNWLVFSVDTINLPNPSGLYDIEIYTTTGSIEQAIWGTWTDTWTATSDTWSEIVGTSTVALVDMIYSDRAYFSGSNESSITQYSSPNENGTYTTYNG